MYKLLILIITLFILSCGDSNSDKGCKNGDISTCNCEDGSISTKICKDDGEWGECSCETDLCKDVECEEGKICNPETGVCILDGDFCNSDNNCEEGTHCNLDINRCVDDIVDPCEGITCSNYGACEVQNDQPICICNDGYHAEGLECIENNIENPCEGITCSNHGTCEVQNDQPVCICDDGYHVDGLSCIENIDPCDQIVCGDNGECVVNDGVATCDCNNGYQYLDGEGCISLCEDINCSDHGECNLDENFQPFCECDFGYQNGDNLSCLPICTGVNCSNHGSCIVDNENQPSCVCETGYVNSENGLECLNICENVNCSENSHCEADQNNEPICICDDGYQDNDGDNSCEQSCEIFNCPNGKNCDDLTGTPQCLCPEGYQDNDNDDICKVNCEFVVCENGICDDSTGEAICTCNDGYQDNDGNYMCRLACQEENPCGGYGDCDDSTGIAICSCYDGYQDNDEDGICKEACSYNRCGENGFCSDDSGDISCTCHNGYYENETHICVNPCSDITCSNHGDCISNSLTDIYCSCDFGYYAVGLTCTSPCEGVDCSGHGSCEAVDETDAVCNCEDGYQDNDDNLTCLPSCDSLNSCGDHGISCDDSGESIVCICEEGYQDSDNNGSCLEDCTTKICDGDNQTGVCNVENGYAICEYLSGYNWTHSIGSTGQDYSESVTTDQNGNIYICGYFTGTVDFNPFDDQDIHQSSGSNDIFITKYHSDGTYGWTYSVGSNNSDKCLDIEVSDNGTIYATGFYSGMIDFDPTAGSDLKVNRGYEDIFITKLFTDGTYNSTYVIGASGYQMPNKLTLDQSGDIYLTGSFSDNVDFDGGPNNDYHSSNGLMDIFITKISSNLIYQWTKTYGDIFMDEGIDVAVDSLGDIYLTGYFTNIVDFDFTDGVDIHQTGDNCAESNCYNKHFFLTKISSEGNYLWTKSFGDTGNITPTAIKLDQNEDIVVSGYFQGDGIDFDLSENSELYSSVADDGFVIKFNSLGDNIWSKQFGTDGNDSINDIYIFNENIYLTGHIGGTTTIDSILLTNIGMKDITLLSLNSDSTLTLGKIFGGTVDDSGESLTISSDGKLYITGYYRDSVDFNPDGGEDIKVSENNSADIFLFRWLLE